MDVSTSISTIIRSLKVHKIPLEAQGPIRKGLSALLIGRSSATLQGIFVHSGVIDANFTWQIHAMVSTPSPPVTILAKTRIAQLILLSLLSPKQILGREETEALDQQDIPMYTGLRLYVIND
ncbi:hypothetical protein Nmel_007545, partial [Mimus melanotis]